MRVFDPTPFWRRRTGLGSNRPRRTVMTIKRSRFFDRGRLAEPRGNETDKSCVAELPGLLFNALLADSGL
jgi:hypothetical protein